MLLIVPSALMGLLAWSLTRGPRAFDKVGPRLLGVFPLTVMFLVTSVVTLRERTGGTLERLLTMPMRRGEFVGGYALSFGLGAVVQGLVVSSLSYGVYGLAHEGLPIRIVFVALCSGLLGTASGLALSALAHTEFQAVQFMPAFVLPQLLLSGVVVPIATLPPGLHQLASVLPLTAAINAVNAGSANRYFYEQIAIIAAYIIGALVIGSATLRRQTR